MGLQQCCQGVMGKQCGNRGACVLARGAQDSSAVRGAATVGSLVVKDVGEALRAGQFRADLLFVGEFEATRTETFAMAFVTSCLGNSTY